MSALPAITIGADVFSGSEALEDAAAVLGALEASP